MKILLVGSYIRNGQKSMARYCSILESQMKEAGHEVRVVRPEPWVGRLANPHQEIGKWLGYIDKFLLFPVCLRGAAASADVVHVCDHSDALYIRHLQGTR